MNILPNKPPTWLSNPPENDVVIGCWGVILRNIAGRKFPIKLGSAESETIFSLFEPYLFEAGWNADSFTPIEQIDPIHRLLYYERLNIPEGVVHRPMHGLLAVSEDESKTVLVNWVDHINLIVRMRTAKFDEIIYELTKFINYFDDAFEWAKSDKFGYLSSNPMQSGAGVILGAYLHVPATILLGKFGRLKRELIERELTVASIWKMGVEEASGIINLKTRRLVGMTAEQLVAQISRAVEDVVAQEVEAREKLWEKSKESVEDKILRSAGIVTYAKLVESWELSTLLSAIRLGISLGVFPMPLSAVDSNLILARDAHLATRFGEELTDQQKLSMRRAQFLAETLWFS